MDDGSGRGSRVVVGVDGSDPSVEALRWAARQARLTGATLCIVTAWDYPEHATPFGIVPELPSNFDPVEKARLALDTLAEAILGSDPGVVVLRDVVRGAPVPVLLEYAQGAELLVLGSRGRGAVAGVLLGSVSVRCLTHASCPVAVIRRTEI